MKYSMSCDTAYATTSVRVPPTFPTRVRFGRGALLVALGTGKRPVIILFVLHRMHPNLRETGRALAANGIKCVYVVASVGPSEPEVHPDRILIDPHNSGFLEMGALLEGIKPDVLVQRNFDAAFEYLWFLSQESGVKTFRYTQDPQFLPFQDAIVRPVRALRMVRDFARYSHRLGAHTIVTPVKSWGVEGKRPIATACHVAFPMPVRSRLPSHAPSVVKVLTVAKHGQRRKRIRWLLKAIAGLGISLQIEIVGSSPGESQTSWKKHDRSLRIFAARISRPNLTVNFHDDLSETQLRELYGSADLFVMPAKREYMSISPLEAMAHGIPVLVSSDSGSAGYVRGADPRQVFPARSYWCFRKKLKALLLDKKLRMELSSAAVKAVKINHSPSKFVNLVKNQLG